MYSMPACGCAVGIPINTVHYKSMYYYGSMKDVVTLIYCSCGELCSNDAHGFGRQTTLLHTPVPWGVGVVALGDGEGRRRGWEGSGVRRTPLGDCFVKPVVLGPAGRGRGGWGARNRGFPSLRGVKRPLTSTLGIPKPRGAAVQPKAWPRGGDGSGRCMEVQDGR